MNKGVQNLTNKPRQTGNVTVYELLISSLAMTDALAKLLIEKGLITPEEFMQKVSEERATYQRMLRGGLYAAYKSATKYKWSPLRK
jgi:hypothetical protein